MPNVVVRALCVVAGVAAAAAAANVHRRGLCCLSQWCLTLAHTVVNLEIFGQKRLRKIW